jgi:hypothetical protein
MGEASRLTGSRAPSNGADDLTTAEEAIDEVLAESFPASDAPPWTLGLDPHSAYVADSKEPDASAVVARSGLVAKPR